MNQAFYSSFDGKTFNLRAIFDGHTLEMSDSITIPWKNATIIRAKDLSMDPVRAITHKTERVKSSILRYLKLWLNTQITTSWESIKRLLEQYGIAAIRLGSAADIDSSITLDVVDEETRRFAHVRCYESLFCVSENRIMERMDGVWLPGHGLFREDKEILLPKDILSGKKSLCSQAFRRHNGIPITMYGKTQIESVMKKLKEWEDEKVTLLRILQSATCTQGLLMCSIYFEYDGVHGKMIFMDNRNGQKETTLANSGGADFGSIPTGVYPCQIFEPAYKRFGFATIVGPKLID